MFQVTSTPNAPAAIGPYSQGITANGFLFASGQVPLMPGSGEVVGTTIEEQADRACKNIQAILEANGLTCEDVVKTTCFLADMATSAPSMPCMRSISSASPPVPAWRCVNCPRRCSARWRSSPPSRRSNCKQA